MTHSAANMVYYNIPQPISSISAVSPHAFSPPVTTYQQRIFFFITRLSPTVFRDDAAVLNAKLCGTTIVRIGRIPNIPARLPSPHSPRAQRTFARCTVHATPHHRDTFTGRHCTALPGNAPAGPRLTWASWTPCLVIRRTPRTGLQRVV